MCCTSGTLDQPAGVLGFGSLTVRPQPQLLPRELTLHSCSICLVSDSCTFRFTHHFVICEGCRRASAHPPFGRFAACFPTLRLTYALISSHSRAVMLISLRRFLTPRPSLPPLLLSLAAAARLRAAHHLHSNGAWPRPVQLHKHHRLRGEGRCGREL